MASSREGPKKRTVGGAGSGAEAPPAPGAMPSSSSKVRRSKRLSADSDMPRTGRRGICPKELPFLMIIAIGALWYNVSSYFSHLEDTRPSPSTLPFSSPAVTELPVLQQRNESMLWGSYRPGLYLGMRMRRPESLMMGLMWWDPARRDLVHNIRHEALERDGMAKLGWLEHDGTTYGRQEIWDGDFNISTTMLKDFSEGSGKGGDWAVSVAASQLEKKPEESSSDPAKPPPKRKISFLVYVAEEGAGARGRQAWEALPQGNKPKGGAVTLAVGESQEIGGWAVHLTGASKSVVKVSHLGVRTPHMHNLTDLVKYNIVVDPAAKAPTKAGAMPPVVLSGLQEPLSNLHMFQISASLPLNFSIAFVSGIGGSSAGGGSLTVPDLKQHLKGCLWKGSSASAAAAGGSGGDSRCLERASRLSGNSLRALQSEASRAFKDRFNRFLGSDIAREHRGVAAAALSNMLGGMGYFYGSSRVGILGPDGRPERIEESWQAPLFSAVPSRTFFPRGFLWDEGFHHLLISRWDPLLTVDSLAHWLDLLSSEGWIPREQIRGLEAISRVPLEFVVQRPTAANPPTLFLPILRMAEAVADAHAEAGRRPLEDESLLAQKSFLIAAYPRLEKWFLWFNSTQAGNLPGTYRWRGRDPATNRELNPKTLTSGLDDYPRASHPSDDERHVDLRCWMALAAKALSAIGRLAGFPTKRVAPYEAMAAFLSDFDNLNRLHYDKASGLYLDYGLHTESAKLKKVPTRVRQDGTPVEFGLRRIVTGSPQPGFIPHPGYVSLFPFLMKLIPPGSKELTAQLSIIQDPEKLWTPYGLRSLSKSSSVYQKHNTEHDAPYWRGAIWININYLALGSLKYYSEQPGPNREGAATLYRLLRKNLLSTITNQYKKTGYLWEQYSDVDGQGKGCKPFTGWTALVALIAAESY